MSAFSTNTLLITYYNQKIKRSYLLDYVILIKLLIIVIFVDLLFFKYCGIKVSFFSLIYNML